MTEGPLTDAELAELERIAKYAEAVSMPVKDLRRLLSEVRAVRAERASREGLAYLAAVAVRVRAEAETGPGMFAWAATAENKARAAFVASLKS